MLPKIINHQFRSYDISVYILCDIDTCWEMVEGEREPLNLVPQGSSSSHGFIVFILLLGAYHLHSSKHDVNKAEAESVWVSYAYLGVNRKH